MSLVAKLAAVGAGGGALAIGGTYLFKHISDVIPLWHSLAEDKDYTTKSTSQGEYHQKYGATYSNYLVGVDEAAGNNQPKSNDLLWNWIYLNRFKRTSGIKGKFSTVTKAIGNDSSLKDACAKAYKETKQNNGNKIKETGEPTNDEFLEEDIWKFCSPIGQKPTTVGEEEKKKYKDKLGEDEQNSSKFISVEDPGNEIFWTIRQKEFFSESGKFSPKSDSNETFFKPFYDTENTKPERQRKTIKSKCKEAYLTSKTNQQSTNPSVDKIVKYCSLDGS